MSVQAGGPDLAAIKQRQQAMWASGDFPAIGAVLYPTAEVLVEDAELSAGQSVLDVACGTGNAAIAAARRFTNVVGIDYVPELLDRARLRADAEGFAIDFQIGDAEALPFGDGVFDVVLSAFGVMFAPDQQRAADELVRVCKPGGRIALANWTATGAASRYQTQLQRYFPAPPMRTPWEWGRASRLNELFPTARSIRMRDQIWLRKAESAEAGVEFFMRNFGPWVELVPRLTAEQAAEFTQAMIQLMHDTNRATDGTISSALEYVTVIIDL